MDTLSRHASKYSLDRCSNKAKFMAEKAKVVQSIAGADAATSNTAEAKEITEVAGSKEAVGATETDEDE